MGGKRKMGPQRKIQVFKAVLGAPILVVVLWWSRPIRWWHLTFAAFAILFAIAAIAQDEEFWG